MHRMFRSWLLAGAATAAVATGIGALVHETASTATAAPSALTDDRIADVAEATVASVVNISTSRAVQVGPFASDPFFNDPRSPFYMAPSDRKATSLGSGVVITAQGRILTNAHVVQGADDIVVTLADGSEHGATLVGADPRSDLAVLQLERGAPPLKPLAFGDSSKLRLGEVVIAIGNPFGVGQAVTMGIVSATGRASVGIVDYEDFIQTDAAINPGNSGGALVNLRGELVGINTAILSRTGGYQGIGFAIPSEMARPIMESLVKDGKVSRGFIGVNIQKMTRALASEYKLSAAQGVLIADVVADGPAARAGLKPGDVVTAVDGAAVTDTGHFRNKIAMKGAGKSVELAVVRGKGKEQIRVTLGELPDKATKQQIRKRGRN
jgi:Do/DeqQ family serine protease